MSYTDTYIVFGVLLLAFGSCYLLKAQLGWINIKNLAPFAQIKPSFVILYEESNSSNKQNKLSDSSKVLLSKKGSVVNPELIGINELKNQFINNLNQEIYAPVTGISDLTMLLLINYNYLTESQKRGQLRTIIKSSERLEYLVSSVLDLSRLSSHHSSLNLPTINLSEKLQEIMQAYKELP